MTEFVQNLVGGLALGAVYALVCLGFVVVYKSTGVLNLAQGGLVILGAYATRQFVQWNVPFGAAMLGAVLVAVVVAIAIERLVLRRLGRQPPIVIVMATVGLLFVFEPLVTGIWGFDLLTLGDPWGIAKVRWGPATVQIVDLWTVALAAVLLALFFAFFRYSTLGIAMRATALDPEAALAQGISARTVYALAWSIAAIVGVVSGVMLSAGSQGVSSDAAIVAFKALPAMILGGLTSTAGAVIGGLVIGVTEVLTAGYVDPHVKVLGSNFHTVMPYVVMVAIMIVRPYGLFGSARAERV